MALAGGAVDMVRSNDIPCPVYREREVRPTHRVRVYRPRQINRRFRVAVTLDTGGVARLRSFRARTDGTTAGQEECGLASLSIRSMTSCYRPIRSWILPWVGVERDHYC